MIFSVYIFIVNFKDIYNKGIDIRSIIMVLREIKITEKNLSECNR